MNPKPSLTRLAAAFAVAALASGGLALAAAPAQAAPVFSELVLRHAADLNWSGGACKTSNQVDDLPDQITMTENTSVASHAMISETVSSIPAPADKVDATATVVGTAKTSTRNGLPQSVEIAFRGAGKTVAAQGPSDCGAEPWASLKLQFAFTLTQPMWVTLSYTKAGSVKTILDLWEKNGAPEEFLDSRLWKGTGSSTLLLPAGSYGGYVDAQSYMATSTVTKTVGGSGIAKMTFAPVGSASKAPSGKAQGYAALGKARSCSTHTLPAKLTTSSKKIKRIAKVSFAVNGKTVKTLRGKAVKRGARVSLRLSDGASASVKTTVRFKSGKSYTAKASYRPCS